ncbi:AraC family transcriptional regulator [Hyunsoonleella pacifica]|uniref:AraC family transcriptional regulator n=1 Tax=Hyunsoonleella pacifica TaxID=1080224 RepID=A0A4Q9FRW7_9FLAO|nr:AraC family transcriptional regulator [Hyunsoonleella pacifica]TBN18657.1 AraC family transcriptional regulator [Hyunsoonleella pacifica]GGD03602.1 transcriptional regulator [Hyunsoonleella pacifica]
MDNTFVKEGFLGQKMIALPEAVINIIKNNAITKKFYITDLGYYPVAHNHYRLRKKGAKEFIFIYCTKGKGEIIINNTKTEIAPNQLFIIPKKVQHEYRADASDPWSIYWFHFNGSMAPELYERYKTTNYNNYKDVLFSTDKINLFNKIFDLFERNYLEKQIEYANLLSLGFISSFVYHNANSRAETNQRDTLVDQIKSFLLSNLGENFTLIEIANKFNYSKSYLHTKFKKETGYPVMVFFNLKKIQKACEYLNYTDMSIKEVSYKTGFDDPLYFSRIFKNFMGKSPRHYRQSKRK